MATQPNNTELFNNFLFYSREKSIVECEFFEPETSEIVDLIGEFATQRLSAFSEHASGSLICFYSSEKSPLKTDAIAWMDSEGSPFGVIAKDFSQFISLIPYGSGFLNSVAAIIENSLNKEDLIAIVKTRIKKEPNILLLEAEERYPEIIDLKQWLKSKDIKISDNPIQEIIEANQKYKDLLPWILDNLN